MTERVLGRWERHRSLGWPLTRAYVAWVFKGKRLLYYWLATSALIVPAALDLPPLTDARWHGLGVIVRLFLSLLVSFQAAVAAGLIGALVASCVAELPPGPWDDELDVANARRE
jgi:hypothetical protein